MASPARPAHPLLNPGAQGQAGPGGSAPADSPPLQRAYLCIVSAGDVPVFETVLTPIASRVQLKDYLKQFLVNAALDNVEFKQKQTQSQLLFHVDKFNDVRISTWLTAGNAKFMLLHDLNATEAQLKNFFTELNLLYLKTLLNPFWTPNAPIVSPVFEGKVRALAEALLPGGK